MRTPHGRLVMFVRTYLSYVLHERTFDFSKAFLEKNTGFDDLLLLD
jgi:hypothetical protein